MDDRNHDLHAAGAVEQDAYTAARSGARNDGAAAIDGTGQGVGADELATGAAGEAVAGFTDEQVAAEALAAQQLATDRLNAYRQAALNAMPSINGVIGEAVAIASLLTWSPDREREISNRIAGVAQHLATFNERMKHASDARTLLDPDTTFDPVNDEEDHFGGTLDGFREMRRQLDGLIDVLGSDVCNTPALVATSRAMIEASFFASVRAQGLGIFLARAGAAR